jgi:glycosyltransferase involved in cell wall biosynthesis
MRKINVSIIIPVYNVEKYIIECVNSILRCNLYDKEVIFVNDGSTDKSISLLNSLIMGREKFVKVINQPNAGPSAARNTGLKYANGDYITFIDSDDIVHSESIDKMYNIAKQKSADIVVADYYEFNDISKKKKYRYDKANFYMPLQSEKDRLSKIFFIDISFAVWNKLYRKNFLFENNISFAEGLLFEDLDFVFQCFYFARKIVKANYLYIGYRQRAGSIMKTLNIKALDKLHILNDIRKFLIKENKFEYYKEEYKILHIKMIFSLLFLAFKGRHSKGNASYIVSTVLNDDFFHAIFHEKLVKKHKLQFKEKILFALIKYHIINERLFKNFIKLGI